MQVITIKALVILRVIQYVVEFVIAIMACFDLEAQIIIIVVACIHSFTTYTLEIVIASNCTQVLRCVVFHIMASFLPCGEEEVSIIRAFP